MTDCILLLRSNYQGYPQPGGPTAHFVRVGAATMRPVNQMTSGGRWPGSDCAVACMRSALLDRGITAPTLTLEAYAGTSQYGTTSEGIVYALSKYNVRSHIVRGDPQPGWCMNPAWGGLLPPSMFQAYLAASLHVYVQIDDAAPVIATHPIVGQPEKPATLEGMNAVTIDPVTGAQRYYRVDSAGHIQHKWYVGNAWSGYQDLTQTLGKIASGSLAAATTKDGSAVVLFWRATDGKDYEAWMTTSDNKWSPPVAQD